jgi:hypothetical protein
MQMGACVSGKVEHGRKGGAVSGPVWQRRLSGWRSVGFGHAVCTHKLGNLVTPGGP